MIELLAVLSVYMSECKVVRVVPSPHGLGAYPDPVTVTLANYTPPPMITPAQRHLKNSLESQEDAKQELKCEAATNRLLDELDKTKKK